MLRKRLLVASTLLLFSFSLAAAASKGRWLHVRVEEHGDDAERVSVNIPLSLVEKVLPLVDHEDLRHGKVRIANEEIEGTDLRAIWQAIRDSEDAEFVTVEGTNDHVRVSKSGDYFLVKVTSDSREKKENVHVRVPMKVVDALFSGDSGELDVLAAVQALGAHDDGDLVQVDGDDSHVRIWVDSLEQGR